MHKISIVLLLATAALSQGSIDALAMKDAGVQACYNWCGAHNKTPRSVNDCVVNCNKYYCAGNNPECLIVVYPGGLSVSPGKTNGLSPSGSRPRRIKPPSVLLDQPTVK